ncbi:MAG: DEAD/DEAH box helicase family protein [Chloroflexi bacterium]|nr:DEAD/DEAH box helicase family protein [Chloroflexota bacterium]
MPRTKKTPTAQLDLTNVRESVKTAPCVPALREAVKAWQAAGYEGATRTTRSLLKHWFYTDHQLPDGTRFQYHNSQQEAIETIIYLWEVEKVRTRNDLLQRFTREQNLRLSAYDTFPRYAIKMATGSGKTKVMSLAVVWQFLNAMRGEGTDYARTFLVIAPNVIVFERLRTDFGGGFIFKTDPLVPKEMKLYWDLDCILRGEGERAPKEGALFLTNIQQLYEDKPAASDDGENEEISDLLGPLPPANLQEPDPFPQRIAERGGPLMVINDEAHHTHDEESEWNHVVRRLDAVAPIAAQLDFSATPRFQKGALFPWTVVDYPLKQAIMDGVVKRPVKGVAHIKEAPSADASVRYAGFLTAGVYRWREYREQLEPLDKKPLLFIMLNNTIEADQVAAWLQEKYTPDFGGDQTLVIHTNLSGEVSTKDLEKARKLAREVDEGTNKVNAVVSVLMLREGWDVRNVTVVVGLRPYSSKANILPEQTIGRGLRLMFRGTGVSYQERVDIIGNDAFLDFVEQLERDEDMKLDTFDIGKDKLVITSIGPLADRADYDIALPTITPSLVRKKSLSEEIGRLDINDLRTPVLPRKPGDAAERDFQYEGIDIITLTREFERHYTIPEPQTSQEIIGYYARLIANNLKLPSQFAALVPKVRDFFANKAFGEPVDLDDKLIIRAMARSVAGFVVTDSFEKALRPLLVEEVEPELEAAPRSLSQTVPFPWSRKTYEARKCIYNLVPCENELEYAFARFLDKAEDVEAFTKLPDQFGFAIQYVDGGANMRLYYPDFVARLNNGHYWLLETKGAETVDVSYKDRAAQLWCENATTLTGDVWRYMKVPQKSFEKLQPSDFEDLTALR